MQCSYKETVESSIRLVKKYYCMLSCSFLCYYIGADCLAALCYTFKHLSKLKELFFCSLHRLLSYEYHGKLISAARCNQTK